MSERGVARRALELATDPDVDIELAAGDLLEDADADQDALAAAAAQLEERLSRDPDDVARRARAIVGAAADVGYGGE